MQTTCTEPVLSLLDFQMVAFWTTLLGLSSFHS